MLMFTPCACFLPSWLWACLFLLLLCGNPKGLKVRRFKLQKIHVCFCYDSRGFGNDLRLLESPARLLHTLIHSHIVAFNPTFGMGIYTLDELSFQVNLFLTQLPTQASTYSCVDCLVGPLNMFLISWNPTMYLYARFNCFVGGGLFGVSYLSPCW